MPLSGPFDPPSFHLDTKPCQPIADQSHGALFFFFLSFPYLDEIGLTTSKMLSRKRKFPGTPGGFRSSSSFEGVILEILRNLLCYQGDKRVKKISLKIGVFKGSLMFLEGKYFKWHSKY